MILELLYGAADLLIFSIRVVIFLGFLALPIVFIAFWVYVFINIKRGNVRPMSSDEISRLDKEIRQRNDAYFIDPTYSYMSCNAFHHSKVR